MSTVPKHPNEQNQERGHSCPPRESALCADESKLNEDVKSPAKEGSHPEADKNVRAPAPWLWDKTENRIARQRLYELVKSKRKAEGPHAPGEAWVEQQVGSKGWNTRGYLPHFDRAGTIQMITFRLADSMPDRLRQEWASLREIEDERERQTKIEEYLDRGRGECILQRPGVAAAFEQVMLRFDGDRYRLCAWVIMPNHVHVLVELWTVPLGKLCKSWKGAGANAINRLLARVGQVWEEDYWDRFIRSEEHFLKALHYIEFNPVKAGLTRQPSEWLAGSANPARCWTGPSRYRGGHLADGLWLREGSSPPPWTAMPEDME